MTDYTPSPAFHDAAAYLSRASASSNVSNDVKLELYGLFKLLTVSRDPSTSQPRPSFFDFVGRAKWDAWASVGKTYSDGATAEERYKTVARGLGWTPGVVPPPLTDAAAPTEGASEDIWDKEDNIGSKKGSGMGTAVSMMKAPSPDVDEEVTLHSLALAGNEEAVSDFLKQHASTDINKLDEYGYTALHLACDRGNVDVVRMLLAHGADRTVKDPDDLTPLELAEVGGHEAVLALLR